MKLWGTYQILCGTHSALAEQAVERLQKRGYDAIVIPEGNGEIAVYYEPQRNTK